MSVHWLVVGVVVVVLRAGAGMWAQSRKVHLREAFMPRALGKGVKRMFVRGRLLRAGLVLIALAVIVSPASARQKPECKAINQSQDVAYNSNTNTDPLGTAISGAAAGDTIKVMGTCYGSFSIFKDLTIQGRSSDQHEDAISGGLLTAADVTLRDLTITGSIDNELDLSLIGTTVTGSAGFGIFNGRDSLTLEDSVVSGNAGPGIFQSFGVVRISNSRVTENAGFGIDIHHGVVRIYDSLIAGNRHGGIETAGYVLLSDSVIEGNTTEGVGGGIGSFNVGRVDITRSTIRGNTATQGGGIYNASMTFGDVTITDSVVTGNRATGGPGVPGQGGGIYNGERLSLTNSSVTGNTASAAGGGIFNSGIVTLNGTNSLCANTPDDWPGC